MQDDDKELLARCQTLDTAAFAQLYDRYVVLVYRHSYYLLAGDRAVAEALTEQVFLRAWRNARRCPPERPPLAWLLGIAHSLVAERIRRQRTNGRTPGGTLEGAPPLPAERARAEEREAMLRAILKLRPPQRQVLLLRLVDGMDCTEMASTLHKSEGWVRLTQYKAFYSLHEMVAKGTNG